MAPAFSQESPVPSDPDVSPAPYLAPPPGSPAPEVLPDMPWPAGSPEFPPPISVAKPAGPRGPARWPVAVALLNLTGLSLGYWYAGRRLRAALYLAITAGLLATGFATDAANRPWLWRAIAVVWVGWMALDGWLLARRHPGSATASRMRPGLVATAAVLAVVAGYVLYGVAGDRAFASGQAAQAAGDCATAVGRYDQVTGPYELTLSRNVPAAAQHRGYCYAFQLAVAEHDSGRFKAATVRYHEYLANTPANPLDAFVHANLQRTYLEWGGWARARSDYPTAITAYRDLLKEYGNTEIAVQARTELAQTYLDEAMAFRSKFNPQGGDSAVTDVRHAMENYLIVQQEFSNTGQAATVPQAIAGTFTEAVRPFTNGMFCESLPVLEYFIDLPSTSIANVIGLAHEDRAKALYECGVSHYNAEAFGDAEVAFNKFVSAYPNHALAASVQSALIATAIAQEGPSAIPALPPPLGGNSPGNISVTFYNDSASETEVLISGRTAHRFVLPACATCPDHYANEADACPTLVGKPSQRLRLLAGDYQILTRSTTGTDFRPYLDKISLSSNYGYRYCTFVWYAP
jgi:tetratricopeptide (TPR) repeat protein